MIQVQPIKGQDLAQSGWANEPDSTNKTQACGFRWVSQVKGHSLFPTSVRLPGYKPGAMTGENLLKSEVNTKESRRDKESGPGDIVRDPGFTQPQVRCSEPEPLS